MEQRKPKMRWLGLAVGVAVGFPTFIVVQIKLHPGYVEAFVLGVGLGGALFLILNPRLLNAGVFGFLRFCRRKPLGGIGAFALGALVILAYVGHLVSPADPYAVHLIEKGEFFNYKSPGDAAPDGSTYYMGSDQLGRDVTSRMIYGTRISVKVALMSVSIGVTLGSLMGIFGAYLGGMVDLISQRIVDAFMAFPGLILALTIMFVLGSSLNNVIIVLSILFIPASSRIVRSEALRVKEMVYVEAARAIGGSTPRIILRHVLPNCMAPYIVIATANLGFAIIVEASLSFLGVGVPLDVPSWGGMLSLAGQKYIEVAPWLLLFPSVAICLTVIASNLLGDAMRDVLDPRLRGTT